MRGRTMFMFLIALLLAGGTAILVRARLQQPPATGAVAAPRPVAKPQRSVLVARTAIARGQILKSADLAWQPWPDTAPTQAYIVADGKPSAGLVGWVAREPFV